MTAPETATLHRWMCPEHGIVLDGIGVGTTSDHGPRFCPFANEDGSDCDLPTSYEVVTVPRGGAAA